MRNTGRLAAVLVLGVATAALAGPPLICHSYLHGTDGSRADLERGSRGWKADPEGFLGFLDGEKETLVRMEAIRLAAIAGLEEKALGLRIMSALQTRAEKTGSPGAEFDARFHRVTATQDCESAGAGIPELKECVESLRDDPAAWLAMARACSPLMRSGTLQEHARAFVRAWDLTESMKDGAPKSRLQAALGYDLKTLESYLVDKLLEKKEGSVTQDERLAELRRLAGKA